MSSAVPQETALLYATPPAPCHYLEGRESVNLFIAPSVPMSAHRYDQLITLGFRRGGEYVYRPACPACAACLPTRVPVRRFTPNRSQRRTLTRNQDLTIHGHPFTFRPEHFALYRRYLVGRHRDGGMDDNLTPEGYCHFLNSHWSETWLYEFRREHELIAVAAVDHLADGLSAVYTFFDPVHADRSPGRYAILWQIAEARRRGLDHLYLGFWVDGCRKMAYKREYRPLEAFVNEAWHPLERCVTLRQKED